MFPMIEVSDWLHLPTMLALVLASYLLSIVALGTGLKSPGHWWRAALLVTLLALVGVVGARLFHVYFERWPYFRLHPEAIFTRFDGMTFYGAFLAAVPFGFVFIRLLFAGPSRQEVRDRAAIITALSYGILRLGCFAQGCCWGKITTAPWAVRFFHPHCSMPYLGIPVHPAQLYDSALGFALAISLLFLRRSMPHLRGRLFLVFCLSYSVGRFFTEFFRGDDFRGVDWLGTLSTSQLISIAIFGFSFLVFAMDWSLIRSTRPQEATT